MLPDVHALLVDMDGTLVDSEHVSDRCWADWCRRRGHALAAVLPLSRGRQAVEVMRRVDPELGAAELAADVAAFLSAEIADTDGVRPTPGAAELWARLAALGVPHALVTSATRSLAEARMRAAGLRWPDHAVCGDDVVAGKPAPDGYLRAAEVLGVAIAGCVVVEDAAAGIEAGDAAGARVVAVGGIDHPLSTVTITSLTGLELIATSVAYELHLR